MSVLLLRLDVDDAPSLVTALEEMGLRAFSETKPYPGTLPDTAEFEVIVVGGAGPLEARLQVCCRLRAQGHIGAVVVQARDAREAARLLDAGADDFAVMPVSAAEMALRVRVALNRAGTHARKRWGRMELDPVQRSAHFAGRVLPLTPREYALIACLVEAAGTTVSRAVLLSKVWGLDVDPGSNLVEVSLCRLREKLGADAPLIETVRREGYRLRW